MPSALLRLKWIAELKQRTKVLAIISIPSGRLRYTSAADKVIAKSQPNPLFLFIAAVTIHNIKKKLNIAVSIPELLHVKKVLFVIVPIKMIAIS